MKTYLTLTHLNIHNANAFSSIYTVGFPAVTAWLGAVHALERSLAHPQKGVSPDIKCLRTGIIVHSHDMKSFFLRGNNYKTLSLTSNPLRLKNGEWVRPSFIPEGRIDVNVSLVIEVEGVSGFNDMDVEAHVNEFLPHMKFAGGDLISSDKASVIYLEEDSKEEKAFLRSLMPGYALIERRDLMTSEEDSLDNLLDYLKITYQPQFEGERVVKWEGTRKVPGWIVPIATGFRGIQAAKAIKNQRSDSYSHQFVEPLVTLGEFKFAFRADTINDIMWRYKTIDDLYLCVNE